MEIVEGCELYLSGIQYDEAPAMGQIYGPVAGALHLEPLHEH